MSQSWVVYARPALNHRPALVRYLARYSHRIGLSNGRLAGVKGGRIGLRWLDYRHDRKRKLLWLAPEELVRRFLLHVLPRGFMRIRHYGFLANAIRRRQLRKIQPQLPAPAAAGQPEVVVSEVADSGPPMRCPFCGEDTVQRCGNATVTAESALDTS